jgi:hypothetical protein
VRFQGYFLLWAGLVALPAARVAAQQVPPLGDQKDWTDQDKREFLDYLRSNQPMPKGEARDIALPRGTVAAERPAWALELAPATVTIYPYDKNGYGSTAGGLLGARALYERHFFTWVRGYAGFEGVPMDEKESSGATADLVRWAIPVGLEFALVPLGTSQTRYVILRAGVEAADMTGAPAGSFLTPLTGPSAAWDVALGWERQIPDTHWRMNIALDGLHSITSPGGVGYVGFGATAALAYTF